MSELGVLALLQGVRLRLRPIDLCLNRSFPVGRPQPRSRSPRSLRKARGLASDPKAPDVEIRINHCTIAFGEQVRSRATPLLWAREAGPRATPIAFGARGGSPNEFPMLQLLQDRREQERHHDLHMAGEVVSLAAVQSGAGDHVREGPVVRQEVEVHGGEVSHRMAQVAGET